MGTNSFVWAAVLIMATLDALKDVNGATVNRKFRAQQLIDSIPAEGIILFLQSATSKVFPFDQCIWVFFTERGHFITMQLAKAAKLIDHNVTIYTGTDSGNARDLFVYSLEEEDKYKVSQSAVITYIQGHGIL